MRLMSVTIASTHRQSRPWLSVDVMLGSKMFSDEEWPSLVHTLLEELTLISGTDTLYR